MINLMHGDCLELMKTIPDKSVDMVLTDPPYGTTACKWDVVIPFEPMWIQLKRITKDNGAICLFGSEPFSSHLRLSNLKMFKYDWYWRKSKPSGHLNSKRQPMKRYEMVSIFYQKQCSYFPQGLKEGVFNNNRKGKSTGRPSDLFGAEKEITVSSFTNYPSNELSYSNPNNNLVHPTQKPIELLEYLIKTYTLEGETVLDFTMGSGSTGVACKNLNRNFIGIEKDDKYFEIAKNRIENHVIQQLNI